MEKSSGDLKCCYLWTVTCDLFGESEFICQIINEFQMWIFIWYQCVWYFLKWYSKYFSSDGNLNFGVLVEWKRGDCRTRDPWFRSYTGIMWISMGTKKKSLRLHSTKVWICTLRGWCLWKFEIPGRRMFAAHKTGLEWLPKGGPNASFLMQPKDKRKLMSKGGWMA